MSDDKMKVTQEVPPLTAHDVLEVFGHFQDGLLKRIDERDANVLTTIRDIVSDLLAQYQRITQRADDHERRIRQSEKWIEELRMKYNELASAIQAHEIKIKRIDQGP
jgi:chromosome segregation ATPase